MTISPPPLSGRKTLARSQLLNDTLLPEVGVLGIQQSHFDIKEKIGYCITQHPLFLLASTLLAVVTGAVAIAPWLAAGSELGAFTSVAASMEGLD